MTVDGQAVGVTGPRGVWRRRALWVMGVALLVAMLLAVSVVNTRITRYEAAVSYDVADPYATVGVAPAIESLPVRSTGEGLVLPSVSGTWDALIVEVAVQSNLAGRVLDPYVEMSVGDRRVRQYLERGAAGRRYLNITSLFEGRAIDSQPLTLRAVHGALDPATARLHVMRTIEAGAGPALVVSPHPDDAEIAAFGLYSGRPSWIVTVTVGDAGRNLYGEHFDSTADAFREKARMRVWDSVAIPQIGDVPRSQAINLGYFDGMLATMHRSPQSGVRSLFSSEQDITQNRINPFDTDPGPRAASWVNLVADLTVILQRVRPTEIVLPHPLLDTHPDHQFAAIATLEALQAAGLTGGRLLFYTNHPVGTELHPFGARDGIVSIPPVHGNAPFFQSAVSVPLDRRTRLRKQVALQLQQDLRPEPASRPLR